MPKIKLFTVALATACVTLLLILCCGDDRGNASAQETPCAQWEVTTWIGLYDSACGVERPALRDGEVCALPEGWEPFTKYGDVGGNLWLRRCAR